MGKFNITDEVLDEIDDMIIELAEKINTEYGLGVNLEEAGHSHYCSEIRESILRDLGRGNI